MRHLWGPIVISEIMYHPAIDGDAEYVELRNVSGDSVVLYDEAKNAGWSITDGVIYEFPSINPITVAPGERLVIVRDATAFAAQFDVPEGTQVLQWADGGLKNGGEGIELSRPGDVDGLGVRQWVRIDRVNYGDDTLWPMEADGQGMSLTRFNERAYGNDVANWTAAVATPGTGALIDTGFDAWAIALGLPGDARGFGDDADDDGMTNGLEYAVGTDPLHFGSPISPALVIGESDVSIAYELNVVQQDILYTLQRSVDLNADWEDMDTELKVLDAGAMIEATIERSAAQMFLRLNVQQE